MVRAYHRATCHHYQRYAAGPGWLDWANQPDPFRRFAGAQVLGLEHADPSRGAGAEAAYRAGSVAARPLERASLSELLEYSLGLSAHKEYQGSRWALRINPSSGNLHPTECHLVLPAIAGVCAGPTVAHYAPREHALELRAELPEALWRRLARELPEGSFLVGLGSIHWREAWKYGERAFRYCQHDVGHAIACLSLAASTLGWSAGLAEEWGSRELARLLGLERFGLAEPERAECLLALVPGPGPVPRVEPLALEELAGLRFAGAPSALSADRVEWRAVELVAEACAKPRTPPALAPPRPAPIDAPGLAASLRREESFRALARRRRSAVEMDGRTALPRAAFYRMLARCQAAQGGRPFDALPWEARVALGLFVHRVEGLEPGLYALVRRAEQRALLQAEMRASFAWEEAPGAPNGLGLWLLARGDQRARAAAVSCGQAIAGEGAFSLGMLAEFDAPLVAEGAWVYPRLFWECGAIGQVLYLEAEALGVRATGIGCFFDEPVHECFGLATERWRSLYHFTVGGALEDERLTTLPPYPAAD